MIRRAIVIDAGRIAEIHVYGWRNAYRGYISDQYLFVKMNVEKRLKYFTEILSEGKEEIYVYESDGIIKGFMTIGLSRNEDKKAAFELWGIYIEPQMKNEGIGTQFLNYCEEQARERDCTEVILWVFKKNEKAKSFYEKLGYKPDGKEELIEFFNEYEVRYAKTI